jgi:hypothetical protein
VARVRREDQPEDRKGVGGERHRVDPRRQDHEVPTDAIGGVSDLLPLAVVDGGAQNLVLAVDPAGRAESDRRPRWGAEHVEQRPAGTEAGRGAHRLELAVVAEDVLERLADELHMIPGVLGGVAVDDDLNGAVGWLGGGGHREHLGGGQADRDLLVVPRRPLQRAADGLRGADIDAPHARPETDAGERACARADGAGVVVGARRVLVEAEPAELCGGEGLELKGGLPGAVRARRVRP